MARKSWIRKLEEELHQLLSETDLPERMADILQKYPHAGPIKERAWEAVSINAVEYLVCEAQRLVYCREEPEVQHLSDRPRMDWEANKTIPKEAVERFNKEYPYGFQE